MYYWIKYNWHSKVCISGLAPRGPTHDQIYVSYHFIFRRYPQTSFICAFAVLLLPQAAVGSRCGFCPTHKLKSYLVAISCIVAEDKTPKSQTKDFMAGSKQHAHWYVCIDSFCPPSLMGQCNVDPNGHLTYSGFLSHLRNIELGKLAIL